MQVIEPTGGGDRDSPVDVSLEDEETNLDADPGDHPGRPTGSNKRTGKPDSKRQPKGKHEGKGKGLASRKVINDQVGTFSFRCLFAKPMIDYNNFAASSQRSEPRPPLPPFLLLYL
jgi:hypothetical protein